MPFGKNKRSSYDEGSDLSLPLMGQDGADKEVGFTGEEVNNSHKLSHFVIGVSVGMTFSLLGFQLLLHQFSVAMWSRMEVVLFALCWSTATGVAAYAIFATLLCCASSRAATSWERLEHFFALGVFSGFCSACTATDIRYGLPFHSVLLTLAVACAWMALMIGLMSQNSSSLNNDKETSDAESCRNPSRRSKVLPLVIV